MLKTTPAVFAVENTYQIAVPVTEPSLFWVRIGNKNYYDESNGIIRSMTDIHRVSVPAEELEREKRYTVCERTIINRKPYYPEINEVTKKTFNFFPVPEKDARTYHISDAHNRVDSPIAAANTYGNIDFLILNGDIPDHCGSPENFDNIYKIAEGITRGEKPVVFARGNHDLRGAYAEKFKDYTPEYLGRTYYTFRIGGIWGIVLDCGEDKNDDQCEYGGTVCCHGFRQRQTEFIREVIRKQAYKDETIKTRLVICHNPFTHQLEPPFNIEEETYGEWARLLKDNIKPDLFICGHLHDLDIFEVGSKNDHLGQPCPVVIGAIPEENNAFAGAGLEFRDDYTDITFTDNQGKIRGNRRIIKKN